MNYQFTNIDGSLWFISNDEKVVYNKNKKWYYFDAADGLPLAPQSLYLTKNGRIWCGGSHNQVAATAYLNSDNKWIKQIHDSISWSINENAVTEGVDGGVWFGGAPNPKGGAGQLGGIVKIKVDSNTTRTTPFYISHPVFNSLVLNGDSGLYAATAFGLHSFSEKILHTYYRNGVKTIVQLDPKLKVNSERIIYKRLKWTKSGTLWAATSDGGVRKYFGDKEQKTFTKVDGLGTNVVYD